MPLVPQTYRGETQTAEVDGWHGFYLQVPFAILFQQQQAWATDDVAQIYDKCMADLEQHLHAIPPSLAMNPLTQSLRSLLEAVVLARNSRDGIAALGLLQKVK